MTKVAIVTGSSGNLGQEVVRKFIAGGYKVIGTATSHETVPMDFPADQFEKVVVDLMNEESSTEFIRSVIEKYKNIDAAILTVGGFAMGKVAETKAADIFKQYKLNFETAYHVARPVFAQMMTQNSGRIFLIGSKPGMDARNGKGMVAYGLAKSLIFRLAELMNDEAKGHNVVTSVIVPSTIDTPQNRNSMPDANFSNWVKAEEIADTIYYYCSDAASSLREPVIKVYGNS
jgi:NAD(P)-dependent dehydrogenase (short-subunit alcohol dehydrogenase family)